ncbi:MAG: IPTL-CTERM sorting domain-containing protein [Candidatus Dadabacteria bacterium]|nr:IPTL-CTERM sorting domain-containing protein [Candidatus Dadabacteria bacterium]
MDAVSCIAEVAVTPIPTLSEWGLIAMAGILGIVGFMVLRRRKVTA